MAKNVRKVYNVAEESQKKNKTRFRAEGLILTKRQEKLITIIIIVMCIFLVFWKFIFMENLYLFKDIGCDTILQFFPRIYEFSNQIHTDIIPKWSFALGMGQSSFQTINIGDPFTIMISLFDKSYVPYLIYYTEFFKLLLAGWIIFLWLKELGFSFYISLIGALSYAFSSIMILGGGWYMFSFEGFNIAILLYGMERNFKRNSAIFIPIPFIFASMYQPFWLYLITVLSIIYSIIRFTDLNLWNFRNVLRYSVKFSGYAILGVFVTTFILTGNLSVLLNSPRVGGESSYSHLLKSQPIFKPIGAVEFQSITSRFFSNDLLGTGTNFKGYINYLEAPMVYIGLITLLLFPLVFSYINKRQKIVYGSILVFLLITLVFPYLRWAFWLFTGDYYRIYSLFVSISLLYMALYSLKGIIETNKINLTVLLSTLVILLALLFIDYSTNIIPDLNIQYLIASLLLIYTGLIYLLQYKKYRYCILGLIVVLVAFEAVYMSNITVNKREIISTEEFNSKAGYNDFTIESVNYLKSIDKSFWRLEKDYKSGIDIITSMNDGMVQGYNGTSSYNSFNSKYYINFLAGMKVIDPKNEFQTRWAPGVTNRFLLQSLVGVKYQLCKSRWQNAKYFNWSPIKKLGNVTVYRNNNFLPLGVAFDKIVTERVFNHFEKMQGDFMVLKALVVPDSDVPKYSLIQKIKPQDYVQSFANVINDTLTDSLRRNVLNITNFEQSDIKGEISVNKPKILFFAIPYDKGWKAYIDNKPVEINIVDYGLMGLKLEPGYHKIEIKYEIPYLTVGLTISIISIIIFISLIFWDKSKKN